MNFRVHIQNVAERIQYSIFFTKIEKIAKALSYIICIIYTG